MIPIHLDNNSRLQDIQNNRLGANNAAASEMTTAAISAKLNAIISRIGASGAGARVNFSVQRGVVNILGGIGTNAGTATVTISNVNPARSYIVFPMLLAAYNTTISSTSSSSFAFIRTTVEFENSTTLRLSGIPNNITQSNVAWQVVSFG